MYVKRNCTRCGGRYIIEGLSVVSPGNKMCKACRHAAISKKLLLPVPPISVNFTSNVPQGTEVASVFPFKSSSSPGTIYECRLYKNGATSCQCPGWTRRIDNRGNRECKHTREVDGKKGPILAALNGTVNPVDAVNAWNSISASTGVERRSNPPTKKPVHTSEAPKPIRRFDLDA